MGAVCNRSHVYWRGEKEERETKWNLQWCAGSGVGGGALALRFRQIKEGRGELIFKRKKSNKDLASSQRTMVQKLICAAKQQHRDWTVKDKSISWANTPSIAPLRHNLVHKRTHNSVFRFFLWSDLADWLSRTIRWDLFETAIYSGGQDCWWWRFFFAQHKVTSTVRSPGRTKQIQWKECGVCSRPCSSSSSSSDGEHRERGQRTGVNRETSCSDQKLPH